MVFALGKVQAVFCRQHLTDLFVAIAVVLVTDGFAVIVHPVEHDVAMRMPAVGMTGYDILRVSDTHPFHVLMSDFQHEHIIVS